MSDTHREKQHGTVYWITGLAGAGKTTLGALLIEKLRSQQPTAVHLDGDVLREVFGGAWGFDRNSRLELAMTYARLCKLLADQGVDVVCTTVSMFDAVREWNRQEISHYREIFLDVPLEVLIARDQKGIYQQALSGGENGEVAGLTMAVELPKTPDVTVTHDSSRTADQTAELLYQQLF